MSEALKRKWKVDPRKHFLAPVHGDRLFPALAIARSSLSQRFVALGDGFAANLSAVLETVSIPFALALAAAEKAHWRAIFSAKRISLIPANKEEEQTYTDEQRLTLATDRAAVELQEFLTSPDGIDRLATDSTYFLMQALDSRSMVDAASQLVLQGEVLTWSALETFARDLFEVVLNANPKLIQRILADPTAKQRIPTKFTLDDLAGHNFDMSTSLGTFLVGQQDFSDIKTVKALLEPLFEQDQNVRDTLADRKIWMLSQRRHLIVHRQGIVDQRYVDATGAREPLGSRVIVDPKMLKDDLAAVGAAGAALLVAAGKTTG